MFSIIVFTLIYLSGITILLFFYIVKKLPFLELSQLPRHTTEYLAALISCILGLVIGFVFRKKILKPIQKLTDATDKIAEGDYKVRIPVTGLRSIRILSKKTNALAAELDNVETLRNDFIDNFSHEFKIPIVSIGGFAKLLKNKNLSEEEQQEYIDIIISESERLSNLSNNILFLTRLESQNTVARKTEYNVSEQIRIVIAVLIRKWSDKNIIISFEGDDYQIFADKDLLQQLWTNLIDNAFKYSPTDSEIKVKINKSKNNIVFTVTDSGPGISEYDSRHIFEKFYQCDISHKKNGNGIGLSIAKRVCELHEGSIRIKETDKAGSCFEVVIPCK